jgi:hypothetical protein
MYINMYLCTFIYMYIYIYICICMYLPPRYSNLMGELHESCKYMNMYIYVYIYKVHDIKKPTRPQPIGSAGKFTALPATPLSDPTRLFYRWAVLWDEFMCFT